MTQLPTNALCWRRGLIGLLLFAAFIPALGLAPYYFPSNPTVSSAATFVGYSNPAAHTFASIIAIVGLLGFVLLQYTGFFRDAGSVTTINVERRAFQARDFAELAIIFSICIVAYFPPFLRHFGPYVEDNYFLTILSRMQNGQRPYRDFEFPYGPLMVYLPYYWARIFGYSMGSYYALLAIAEALQFTVLLAIIRIYILRFSHRILALALFGALLCNTILGYNWNGLRRFTPVIVLLMLATAPTAPAMILGASVLLGLLCAYSQDYGLFCLAGALGLYGWLAIRNGFWRHVIAAFAVTGIAVLVWAATLKLVLRDDFTVYLQASSSLVRRFAIGEAGFPFYWTVNSLAVFALFSLSLVMVGCAVGRRRDEPVSAGDRFLLAGVVYAVIGLRSGMNRADMWHLVAPMLPIIVGCTLPLKFTLIRISPATTKLATALCVVIASTYFIALAPSGSYVARGWISGLRYTLAGGHGSQPIASRVPTIETERATPDPEVISLALYLAAEPRSKRPVVIYDRSWSLDKRIGILKPTYQSDNVLLSDEEGLRFADYLNRHADSLVVIDRAEYAGIYDPASATQPAERDDFFAPTPAKKLAGWLSTIHYYGAEIEKDVREQRWKRTVGAHLASHFRKCAQFGEMIVLESVPKSALSNGS